MCDITLQDNRGWFNMCCGVLICSDTFLKNTNINVLSIVINDTTITAFFEMMKHYYPTHIYFKRETFCISPELYCSSFLLSYIICDIIYCFDGYTIYYSSIYKIGII